MTDLNNIRKEEKRNLIISIGFLIITFLLTLTFARGIEGKTYLFHILEYLGGHDIALETNMIGIVVVVFIIIFYLLHRGFYDKIHFIDLKYKYLKFLPLIFLLASIALNLLASNIHQVLLGMNQGLDTIVDECRLGNNYFSYGIDEKGNATDFGHKVNFVNHGSDKVSFYIKFVEMGNPEKSYTITNQDGVPELITIESGENWEDTFRITDINPKFVSNPNIGIKRPRYHVVIYNLTESRTFITYD